MTDRILLSGLRARGFHGVFEEERQLGQDFVVDVELSVSFDAAAASDDLSHTVDYAALADALVAIITGPPVNLIETLAYRLVDACLEFELVEAATVTLHKPYAPIPHSFSDVSVTVSRTR